MQQLKQLHDRLEIFIQKDVSINNYTKQLTDIRIKFKQIQSLNQLYQQKVKILNKIIHKSQQLAKQIPSRSLDYTVLLKELDRNISQIRHNVCHFCGLVFTFEQLNKPCLKNKANLNDFSVNIDGQYCKIKPDVSKLGTQRHFFGPPLNPAQYYNIQSFSSNSFKLQMQALMLKVKTLSKIHNINIQKQLLKNSHNEKFCERIVFDYIFIQLLGLTERQNQILLTLTLSHQQKHGLLGYGFIVQKLSEINI